MRRWIDPLGLVCQIKFIHNFFIVPDDRFYQFISEISVIRLKIFEQVLTITVMMRTVTVVMMCPVKHVISYYLQNR